jgi:hypothetical protein
MHMGSLYLEEILGFSSGILYSFAACCQALYCARCQIARPTQGPGDLSTQLQGATLPSAHPRRPFGVSGTVFVRDDVDS